MRDRSIQLEPFRAPRRRVRRGRAGGFTLIELLVVIGIIGIVIGILLPTLSIARDSAKKTVCASNLRQIANAALLYANDSKGFWPPAHIDFYSINNDRWHGTRPDNNAPFDFEKSRLRKEIGTGELKNCPSFIFVEGSVGFEQSCGGYGYNDSYLGSGLGVPALAHLSLPLRDFEEQVVNTPAKIVNIHNASSKIAFGDAAIANPSLVEYSFVTPPLDADGNATTPTLHFRHRGAANIAWADGHVTTEKMDWTYETPNVYGADNRRMKLGFFGPHDNRLFARD